MYMLPTRLDRMEHACQQATLEQQTCAKQTILHKLGAWREFRRKVCGGWRSYDLCRKGAPVPQAP